MRPRKFKKSVFIKERDWKILKKDIELYEEVSDVKDFIIKFLNKIQHKTHQKIYRKTKRSGIRRDYEGPYKPKWKSIYYTNSGMKKK